MMRPLREKNMSVNIFKKVEAMIKTNTCGLPSWTAGNDDSFLLDLYEGEVLRRTSQWST